MLVIIVVTAVDSILRSSSSFFISLYYIQSFIECTRASDFQCIPF